MRCEGTYHSWRGYVYGGDSPGGDMVGNVTEDNSVCQGGGQILTQRHLKTLQLKTVSVSNEHWAGALGLGPGQSHQFLFLTGWSSPVSSWSSWMLFLFVCEILIRIVKTTH